MKPKTFRAGDVSKSAGYDRCQTPAYAVDPVLPYIRKGWRVWEPAAGDGHIMAALASAGVDAIGSDILDGHNFFEWQPESFDCIVTNPPYSVKFDWIERCYELGKPFALLMPLETLGAGRAQAAFARGGMELLVLNKRVNFKMPNVGYEGSSAQFPTAWFTHGMSLGSPIVYGTIVRRADNQPTLIGGWIGSD